MNNSQIYQVSKSDLRPSQSQKRVAEFLELQLQAVVSEQPAVGAGDRLRAFPRAVKCSYCEAISPPPRKTFSSSQSVQIVWVTYAVSHLRILKVSLILGRYLISSWIIYRELHGPLRTEEGRLSAGLCTVSTHSTVEAFLRRRV